MALMEDSLGEFFPSTETIKEHIDKESFKQLFHDHWNDFKATHPRYDTSYFDSIVYKMLDCGDPEKMGFAQYRCLYCGETRKLAFSCKCSFCLSCAKVYTDRWVEFIGRRLFPGVVYRHIVLTVPECLRLWFYRNPALLSSLMQAGYACLSDVFSTFKNTHIDTGSVIVLQTAGRSGQYNPHLHILVASGGIDSKDRWVNIGYIPFELLHRKWQWHLLSMLREEVDDPAINRDIDHCWKAYPKGFVANVQKGEVPPGGKGLAQYLAKYLVSPPISVRRIESYDGLTVRYWYRDHRTESIQHETLPVLRFIGRMIQHILPKGFQRIRYYGFHANVRYEQMREKLASIIPAENPDNPLGCRVIPRKPFAQLFFQAFGTNPLLCPACGTEMELELIKHPEYGIVRDFNIFGMEPTYDTESKTNPTGERPSFRRTERVVQLPLQFM